MYNIFMNTDQETPYELGERTYQFARAVRAFVRTLKKTVDVIDDIRQVVRSSGSVGANYIEANESLGKKDLLLHFRISRKEAKESIFWLRLIREGLQDQQSDACEKLIDEAQQLVRIFSTIIAKALSKDDH